MSLASCPLLLSLLSFFPAVSPAPRSCSVAFGLGVPCLRLAPWGCWGLGFGGVCNSKAALPYRQGGAGARDPQQGRNPSLGGREVTLIVTHGPSLTTMYVIMLQFGSLTEASPVPFKKQSWSREDTVRSFLPLARCTNRQEPLAPKNSTAYRQGLQALATSFSSRPHMLRYHKSDFSSQRQAGK